MCHYFFSFFLLLWQSPEYHFPCLPVYPKFSTPTGNPFHHFSDPESPLLHASFGILWENCGKELVFYRRNNCLIVGIRRFFWCQVMKKLWLLDWNIFQCYYLLFSLNHFLLSGPTVSSSLPFLLLSFLSSSFFP